MSIPQEDALRKGHKSGEGAGSAPSSRRRPGASPFTAAELAEIAAADAALGSGPVMLTPEERALSDALDLEAMENDPRGWNWPGSPARRARKNKKAKAQRDAETPEHRAARLARLKAYREAHREEERARCARYNERHRQERRDYQKAYDAAHREEINAARRARREKKKETDNREDNNGRKI